MERIRNYTSHFFFRQKTIVKYFEQKGVRSAYSLSVLHRNMPLSGEYTWSETAAVVEVAVPLKGVSRKTVDVCTTSNILKVSYKPFLLDLNLFQEIVEDKSKAVFKDGVLHISLAKKESKLWGQLCFIGSRDETAARRDKSLKLRDEQNLQRKELVAATKFDEERMMLREHMALEEKERQRMDDIKYQEKKIAEDEMFGTFATLREAKQDYLEVNKCLKQPIRASFHATFAHTPRLFKTPLRQSTKEQEEDFIRKNRAILHRNALLNQKDNISDNDPVWLKSKADEFYQRGDFASAINAYSETLTLDPYNIQVLMNRAASHLASRDFAACLNDCNAALSHLSQANPKSESSECTLAKISSPVPRTKRRWQVIILCRRATSKQLTNDLLGAKNDLKQALEIAKIDNDVNAKSISKDLSALEADLESLETQDAITD